MTEQVADAFNKDNEVHQQNIRSVFYKKPIKKNNYNLDIDYNDSPQEMRRQQLLDHQKESRDTAFNAARKMVDDALLSDEHEELMEVDVKQRHIKRYKYYANKLMMSEWMLDVPDNLLDKWSVVACPKGKRNLIVACKGKTQTYSRRGKKLSEFNSALPGGNSGEHTRHCTILDCIWVAKQETYYVLDVLAWSTQPLLNCDAEFRRFWLDSKLKEITQLKTRDSIVNNYPILSLPNARCDDNLSDFILNLPCIMNLNLPLDGFLFYHRDGFYMHGITPLVTWLKPFMMTEVLGISLPSHLDDKPDGYIDHRHYILSKTKKSRTKLSESMDVTNAVEEPE